MIAHVLSAAVTVIAAPAHAGDRVGVIVAGDESLQAAVTAELATWLRQQGHGVEAAPLPAVAVDGFLDCFVLEDTACARKIVDREAHADAILYARVESRGAGSARNVTISAHWIAKNKDPISQKTVCERCTNDALGITLDAILYALPGAAAATGTAAATSPAPASVTASAPEPTPVHHGLAVGAELGEPASATVGWFAGKLALLGAIGTGTVEGVGISLHADAQLEVKRLAPAIPLRVGLGARYYHHGYDPQSVDEIPDSHVGIRASAALGYERGPLELYAELAPGVDVTRTASCTLADGPRSICPHAQESPLFVQLVIGARWFISH